MQNLLNNVANCEKLLASGQVKDFNRKESIQLMINQFNTQIKELEKSKLTQQESLFKRLERTQGYLFDSDYAQFVLKKASSPPEAVTCSTVAFLLRYRAQSAGMFPLTLRPADISPSIMRNKASEAWQRPEQTNGAVWFSDKVAKDAAGRVKKCAATPTPERALVDKMEGLSAAEEPTPTAALAAERRRWFDRDSQKTQKLLELAGRVPGLMGTTAFENAARALALRRPLWQHLEEAGGRLAQEDFRRLVLDVPPASANLSAEIALRDAQRDKTVVQSLLYFLTRYANTPDLWDRSPYGSAQFGSRPAELQGKLILDAGTRRDLEVMKAYEYDEGGRPADTAENVLNERLTRKPRESRY